MDKIIKMAQKLNDCFEYKTFDRGTDGALAVLLKEIRGS